MYSTAEVCHPCFSTLYPSTYTVERSGCLTKSLFRAEANDFTTDLSRGGHNTDDALEIPKHFVQYQSRRYCRVVPPLLTMRSGEASKRANCVIALDYFTFRWEIVCWEDYWEDLTDLTVGHMA